MPGRDRIEPPGLRGAKMSLAAGAAVEQGNFGHARVLFEDSLQLFRQANDPLGIAGALYSLGGIAWLQDDFETATSLFLESLDLFKKHGDASAVALAQRSLGLAYAAQGDDKNAQTSYEESVEIYEDMSDPLEAAISRECLGTLLEKRGEAAEARILLEACLDVYEEAGEQKHLADTLSVLARCAADEDDYWTASALLRDELAIRIQLGDDQGTIVPLEWFAVFAATQGFDEEAAVLLGASDTRCKRTRNPRSKEENEKIEALVFVDEPISQPMAAARKTGRSLSNGQLLGAVDALIEKIGELLPVGPIP